jgi:hypothetical protein
MPKVLKAYNTDYKIAVQQSGTITLDTGLQTGTVVVTGNLEVRGETATVNTTDLSIEDNIILLSSGTQGSGLPSSVGFSSGIEIERGSLPNARWIFDEQVSWTLGGTSGTGTFYADAGGQKLPLNTPGIVAQGDFYIDAGAGVISVTNTPDYEEKVFNYNNGVIEPDANGRIVIDDDNIPNAKAIKDYIDYNFVNRSRSFVSEGDTVLETIDEFHPLENIISINPEGNNTTVIETAGPHRFVESDTVDIAGIQANGDPVENLNSTNIGIIEIINQFLVRLDIDVTSGDVNNYISNSGTISKTNFEESRIKFQVQGSDVANLYNNRFDIAGIEIKDTQISTTESNADLTIKTPGVGSVKIDDILELTTIPYDDDLSQIPVAPQQGVKLYSSNPGIGKTGLYYVNSSRTNDEIVGKNRSLLFSMLF